MSERSFEAGQRCDRQNCKKSELENRSPVQNASFLGFKVFWRLTILLAGRDDLFEMVSRKEEARERERVSLGFKVFHRNTHSPSRGSERPEKTEKGGKVK